MSGRPLRYVQACPDGLDSAEPLRAASPSISKVQGSFNYLGQIVGGPWEARRTVRVLCVCGPAQCGMHWSLTGRGVPARTIDRRGHTPYPPAGGHLGATAKGPGRGDCAPGDCALAQVKPGPAPGPEGGKGRGDVVSTDCEGALSFWELSLFPTHCCRRCPLLKPSAHYAGSSLHVHWYATPLAHKAASLAKCVPHPLSLPSWSRLRREAGSPAAAGLPSWRRLRRGRLELAKAGISASPRKARMA